MNTVYWSVHKFVSFTFFQIDDVQQRNLQSGEQVPVRNIWIRERSVEGKITLWRNHTQLPLTVGSYVCVANIKTNFYRNETCFNSLSNTTITVRNLVNYYFNLLRLVIHCVQLTVLTFVYFVRLLYVQLTHFLLIFTTIFNLTIRIFSIYKILWKFITRCLNTANIKKK